MLQWLLLFPVLFGSLLLLSLSSFMLLLLLH